MRIALLAAATLLVLPAKAASPPSIAGRWVNEDRRAVVEFAPCGAKICGHIQRFLIAEPKGGALDTKNPDKSKRGRKLLGARVFWDLTPDGTGWTGRGYVPEHGRTIKAHLSLADGGKLKLKGCVSLFCKTVLWGRAK